MEATSLTPQNVLAIFLTTKEDRQNFILDMIERVKQGDISALQLHLQVKCMEDVVKQFTSNSIYKRCVNDEADLYEGKSFDYFNAKFEKKEVGVKYDYTNCNDTILNELQAQLTEIEAKVKDRQKFLQTVPVKGMDIVTTDGEVLTVYPPAKSSTTTVAVTLK